MDTTCILCIKKLLLKFVAFYGLCPIKYHCKKDGAGHSTKIYESQLKIVLPILLCLLNTMTFIYNIVCLFNAGFTDDSARTLVSHITSVFYPMELLSLIGNRKSKLLEYKGLCNLKKHLDVFKAKHLCTRRSKLKLKSLNVKYSLATIITICLVFSYYCGVFYTKSSMKNFLKIIHMCITVTRFASCSTFCSFEVTFYAEVRKNCFKQIKNTLENNKPGGVYTVSFKKSKYEYTNTTEYFSTLRYCLAKHIRMLMSLHYNMRLLFKFVNGYYLISLLESICMFVPFVYHLVDSTLRGNYSFESYYFLIFTVGYTYSLILLLIRHEELKNSVRMLNLFQ